MVLAALSHGHGGWGMGEGKHNLCIKELKIKYKKIQNKDKKNPPGTTV